MRRRDQLIILLAFLATFFAWNQEGTVHIDNSFIIPFDDYDTHVGPKPIVGDVDGDGLPEVVTAISRTEVAIIPTYRIRRSYHESFVNLAPTRQVNLYGDIIGLAMGQTEFLNDTTATDNKGKLMRAAVKAERLQTIIVVTSDYQVVAYNHQLQEIWSQHLIPPLSATMVPHSASISISPYRVYKEDKGLVVVGIKVAAPGNTEETAYVGMHGETGEIRWRHTTQDYVPKDIITDPENTAPGAAPTPANYKDISKLRLTDKELDEHAKEVDWTHFREAVVSTLPHHWSHPWHSKLDLHVFFNEKTRNKKASHSEEAEANLGAGGKYGTARYKGRHFEKQQADDYGQLGERYLSARRGRSHKKPSPPPNVLVAHSDEGIDILHLYTGRLITSVKPLNKGSLYADVDDDYHIDEISARVGARQEFFGKHGVEERFDCMGLIKSGIPFDHHHIYNATICDSEGFFPSLMVLEHYMHGDDARDSPTRDPLSLIGSQPLQSAYTVAANPIVIQHQVFKGNGIYKVTRDSVFMIDSGLVTSVSATSKRVMWRADTEASFISKGIEKDHGDADGYFRSKDEKEARSPIHKPQLAVYHYHSSPAHVNSAKWAHRGNDPVVLAVGDEAIVALNAKTGKVETTHTIPRPPEAPLVISDFNGDGINDIMMMTHTGLYGFLVSHKHSGSVVSTLMIMMVALIIILYVTASMVAHEDEAAGFDDPSDAPTAGGGSGGDGRRQFFRAPKSKRATD